MRETAYDTVMICSGATPRSAASISRSRLRYDQPRTVITLIRSATRRKHADAYGRIDDERPPKGVPLLDQRDSQAL
jgi:hypothetical protein